MVLNFAGRKLTDDDLADIGRVVRPLSESREELIHAGRKCVLKLLSDGYVVDMTNQVRIFLCSHTQKVLSTSMFQPVSAMTQDHHKKAGDSISKVLYRG